MSESHDAILTRHEDGTVTVEHADPVIWVSPELLDGAEAWGGPELLRLDTAGEYVYRFLGLAEDVRYLKYERVTGG